jgi:hypothetical protein
MAFPVSPDGLYHYFLSFRIQGYQTQIGQMTIGVSDFALATNGVITEMGERVARQHGMGWNPGT